MTKTGRMEIKRGKNRLVLTLPFLGLVLKLAWSNFRYYRIGEKAKCESILHYPLSEVWWAIRISVILWLEGVIVNWHERVYYKKTKHPILQPTHFSFFGIFNIQTFGRPLVMHPDIFSKEISRIIGSYVMQDKHHFVFPHHFSRDGERLQMNDYGGIRTRAVLDKRADELYENFQLPESVLEADKESERVDYENLPYVTLMYCFVACSERNSAVFEDTKQEIEYWGNEVRRSVPPIIRWLALHEDDELRPKKRPKSAPRNSRRWWRKFTRQMGCRGPFASNKAWNHIQAQQTIWFIFTEFFEEKFGED